MSTQIIIKVNDYLNEHYLLKKVSKFKHDSIIYLSLFELYSQEKFKWLLDKNLNFFTKFYFKSLQWDIKKLILLNQLLCDMIRQVKIWRLIKGYPANGQRTHSNGKKNKKIKSLLFKFRLDQFFKHFGVRKRNIYPTLIIAEYTNRLWVYNWGLEWYQAYKTSLTLRQGKKNYLPFDPVSLAKNITTGYNRTGAASKIGKNKKIKNIVTIGVPVYFSRFLFYENVKSTYHEKLWISDESRKKMGVKRKRNIKKK